jgi:hypothetical protein
MRFAFRNKEITAFWDVTHVVSLKLSDVSEVLTVSIIRAIRPNYGGSRYL